MPSRNQSLFDRPLGRGGVMDSRTAPSWRLKQNEQVHRALLDEVLVFGRVGRTVTGRDRAPLLVRPDVQMVCWLVRAPA
jgi:hypothetical protein